MDEADKRQLMTTIGESRTKSREQSNGCVCVCVCVSMCDENHLLLLLCAIQALNESIVAHESELSEVMWIGGELRLLAVGDDVARLDSELQTIADRYNALCNRSDHRLGQMMEVPAILSRFYASHETVVNCVRQLETELVQRDIQPGPEAELHLQVSVMPQPFLYSCNVK